LGKVGIDPTLGKREEDRTRRSTTTTTTFLGFHLFKLSRVVARNIIRKMNTRREIHDGPTRAVRNEVGEKENFAKIKWMDAALSCSSIRRKGNRMGNEEEQKNL